MSDLKRARSFLTLTAVAVAMSQLAGCGLAQEYYEYYLGGIDEGARQPTGYENLKDVKQEVDRLKVPDGMVDPQQDPTMKVPAISATALKYPVGDDLDIRAPVAPLRSELGLHSQWLNGEAIVWFESDGEHNVHSERDAWTLLDKVLKSMRVNPGNVSADDYSLTTAVADFDEFGSPYNAADLGSGAMRYRQVYRIRIGRNNQGELGIASTLIGSMTVLPRTGKNLENILTPIELERFSMGFSNSIIHVLEKAHEAELQDNGELSITLGRDHNNQESIIVAAKYEDVWNGLRNMLPRFGWSITEYSITNGTIKVDLDDQELETYQKQHVDSFALDEEEYVLRVGEEDGNCVITFYDEDDKALPAATVDRIYSGFSQALSRELNSSSNEEQVGF